MSATSEEINRDIEHIASISKETCATALQVEEASKRLADLSENMETATNQFKL
jgi:methyl-accepting chemotaxis protein